MRRTIHATSGRIYHKALVSGDQASYLRGNPKFLSLDRPSMTCPGKRKMQGFVQKIVYDGVFTKENFCPNTILEFLNVRLL